MMQKTTLTAGVWTQVAAGPHALFWALGRIRIAIGDDAPTDEHTSLTIQAQGQPRSFTYGGTEAVWVRPVERDVEMHLVQISASELYLIDAVGNVLIDGGSV